MPEQRDVVVVGSGFAGICMGIRLKRAGRADFVILEKADDLGGTWRDNTYPGAACDIQSHVYSFSFAPNPRWTRMYSPQQEIWDYLRRCADSYDVTPHLRYGQELTAARFDEDSSQWRIEVNGVERYLARVLVTATGALHEPRIPRLPGAERFRGAAFHSARWNHVVDLTGKRVAVIGTGASAIQLVPQLAKVAARVDVYQRTAPWVVPRGDRPLTDREHRLFERFPIAQRIRRTAMYWVLESRAPGFVVHPRYMSAAEAVARRHLARQVKDPALAAKLTPDYQMGCKRILISSDYYPALQRENVELVTDGIREVTEDGIVATDGSERPVDAIVYGTGFVVSGALRRVEVAGRGRRDLNAEWDRDGLNAHLGISVNGFPNLFMLTGPNTGLGHSSMIFMIEAQTHFVMRALEKLDDSGTVEVRPGIQRSYVARMHGALDDTVWNAGCTSWYLDDKGRNVAMWPGFTWGYWLRTRRPRPREYTFTRGHERSARPRIGGKPHAS